MEVQDSEHIEHLLACIYELNQKQQYESQAIFATMQEKYTLDAGKVQELLVKLVGDGKIHKSEQDGAVKYYIPSTSKRSRKSDGSFTEAQKKEITSYLAKSVKEINTTNENQGATLDEIFDWLKAHSGPPTLSTKADLEKALETELSFMRLKRTESGLYLTAKKRGRPFGTGSFSRRGPMPKVTPTKRSPDEPSKRGGHLGKRKRIKKSNDDYEFYDTPGSTALPPPVTDPICDFCLKTSSCNKQGLFEELLMCKDCNAKAHASCMGYSEILARRAHMGPWQCIDCKTCCLCLDAGDPDDLLFCDACDRGYHMFCHDPALQSKPVNKWACQACLNDGVCVEDLVSSPPSSVKSGDVTQDAVFSEPIRPSSSAGVTSGVTSGPVQRQQSRVSGAMDESGGWSPSHATTPSPGSSSKSYLPPVPSQWNSPQVSQYIDECGFHSEAKVFLEQEIDGKSLMLLQREDIIRNMNLKLGPALKIYEKVKMIQKSPLTKNKF